MTMLQQPLTVEQSKKEIKIINVIQCKEPDKFKRKFLSELRFLYRTKIINQLN